MGKFSEKILEMVEKYLQTPAAFDPLSINDPVANQTQWSPAKSGGTSMCTHRLEEVSMSRMAFKPVPMAMIFPAVFILIGLVVPLAFTLPLFLSNGFGEALIPLVMIVPFSLIFAGVGLFILKKYASPRVFDRSLGYYWKGKKEPSLENPEEIKESCRLGDIYAVQIIQELCTSTSRGHTTRYYSYEINLVKRDTSRINIVDHGNKTHIRTDGVVLAQFLGVPLWDATT